MNRLEHQITYLKIAEALNQLKNMTVMSFHILITNQKALCNFHYFIYKNSQKGQPIQGGGGLGVSSEENLLISEDVSGGWVRILFSLFLRRNLFISSSSHPYLPRYVMVSP